MRHRDLLTSGSRGCPFQTKKTESVTLRNGGPSVTQMIMPERLFTQLITQIISNEPILSPLRISRQRPANNSSKATSRRRALEQRDQPSSSTGPMNKIANVENVICSAETMARHPELFHYTGPAAFEEIVRSQPCGARTIAQ